MTSRVWNGLMVIGISAFLGVTISASAAEQGGQEHGGTTTAPADKEHGGTTQEHGGHEHDAEAVKAEPSAEQIRQAIQGHVQGIAKEEGAFSIQDPVSGATRQLVFVRVHDRVGKTGDLYYSCTDMRDTQTKELLDLDFDVEAKNGTLAVVDQRIHKVNGQARYTYDEHDTRVPVSSTSSTSTPGQERAY